MKVLISVSLPQSNVALKVYIALIKSMQSASRPTPNYIQESNHRLHTANPHMWSIFPRIPNTPAAPAVLTFQDLPHIYGYFILAWQKKKTWKKFPAKRVSLDSQHMMEVRDKHWFFMMHSCHKIKATTTSLMIEKNKPCSSADK